MHVFSSAKSFVPQDPLVSNSPSSPQSTANRIRASILGCRHLHEQSGQGYHPCPKSRYHPTIANIAPFFLPSGHHLRSEGADQTKDSSIANPLRILFHFCNRGKWRQSNNKCLQESKPLSKTSKKKTEMEIFDRNKEKTRDFRNQKFAKSARKRN